MSPGGSVIKNDNTLAGNASMYPALAMSATLGDVVMALLAERGLSLRGFARLVGMPAANLSAITNGHRKPPLKMVEKWAVKLELTPAERHRLFRVAMLAAAPAGLSAWLAAVVPETLPTARVPRVPRHR